MTPAQGATGLAERGQVLKYKLGNQTFTPIATEVMGWINDACTALRATSQTHAVREALVNCLGCVEAAEAEGLHEVIAELRGFSDQTDRLIDLVERRLMWVREYAAPALSTPSASAERAYNAARENLREAWAALAMIRETVETLAPSGSVTAAEHLDGPTFMHEADALVKGIMALASAGPQAEARDIATAAIEIANSVRYAAQLMHDGRSDIDPEKLRWLHHSWGADEVRSKLDDWRDTLSAHPQQQQADERATPSLRDAHKQIPVQVWADVDVGIADAVRYLNTLSGVRTHASCQGTIGEGGAEPYRGHVMASWPAGYIEHLQVLFDITPLGKNWGYLHPRGLPTTQQTDGRGAVIEALEHITELLVDTWATTMPGDPEKEIAVFNARAALQQSPATDGAAVTRPQRESL